MLWFAKLPSTALATMARISSNPSALIKSQSQCFLLSWLLYLLRQPLPLASLDYGTFQGAYSSAYNICYRTKIPFAAPSVRENRFRAPQPPVPITDGIYNSSQVYDSCPQRTANGTEDCLYLGLIFRPWSASLPLHPAVVVYFGGGFIEGGGSFTIPPAGDPVLNVSSSRGGCGSGRVG